ncbi:MAG: Acetyltransferase, GNAT family [uncultured Solirubrobacteraceae bacterium]|uniref:Acetyltransferase, GNAT family n=1 Tax=uncultured Solirubrobacteraceae bacterium TaxID=1162706 RepID=A0A6J4TR37_9ACTN|nr:MAG: Acetyltransferase, GNAT family [uncultured Solirubrobacteraceae bacterium]
MIRLATQDDAPALQGSLAQAFHDDPVASWSLPSERRRPAQLGRFYRERLRTLVPDEMVFCDDERRGAALWTAPDRWQIGFAELARMRIATRRTPLFLVGAHHVDSAHPGEPHYYLNVLGVSPEAQGTGLGTRLIAPMLERCDREGVPAYLESSKERNLVFYERHGFRVTGEVMMPRGGPKLWLMWRAPH